VNSHSSSSAKGWEPPSVEELSAQLPQYQIEALMGRGGMGAVYKGRQTSLDRPVAIKILSNQLEDADASFAERFKNEARALGKLSHPGIVGVYEFGEAQGGLLYIVMEFVDGTDVAKMIAKQGRLHTEHAMAITAHVCDALAYAHERGIIHRDIKPANIMVGYDGVVKVADFGLAKMTHTQNSGLTQSGMAMGTLYYMAPEALTLGSAVDQRADIYAVGVMLYQMLTGKLPQGMFEMPSLQIKGLDPRYDRIVAMAMRDDRELRYPSAKALRLELDTILTQPVVKVEVSAKEAPPALNTQALPKRYGAGHDLQPQVRNMTGSNTEEQQAETVTKPRVGLAWAALLVIAVFGGIAWLVLYQPKDLPALSVTDSSVLPTGNSITSTASLPPATKELPFINTLGMKFVPVPGTDVMFCIHETCYKDYAAYADQAKIFDVEWKSAGISEDHPVTMVSWEDAQKFCAWLSAKEGKTYRLPSDREWSIAVGIGRHERWIQGTTPATVIKEQLEFPWGDKWPPPKFSGNYAYALAPNEQNDEYATTAPVMTFRQNSNGLYDMGGNVWEWVEDYWNDARLERVLRGASFTNADVENLRSSFRLRKAQGQRSENVGFRCVLGVSAKSASSNPAGSAEMLNALASASQNHLSVQHSTTQKGLKEAMPPLEFVRIPGGVFTMGSTSGDTTENDAWPERVIVSEFYLQATETTKAQWDEVRTWALSNGYRDMALADGKAPHHPVHSVSWWDAVRWCNARSEKDGLKPVYTVFGEVMRSGTVEPVADWTANGYRLPTEAEWEKAARGGVTGKRFPWGADTISHTHANFRNDGGEAYATGSTFYHPRYNDGQAPYTSPVASFKANNFGLHDMAGNVWEWCWERYTDSRLPTGEKRVLRGGSWDFYANSCTAANRGHEMPANRVNRHGFRPARSSIP
jgi:formylglycine-generating enzyme required for sulfatase activity/serine/threonine protein kinase